MTAQRKHQMTAQDAIRLALDPEARSTASAYDLARAADFLTRCAADLILTLRNRFDLGEVR